MRTVLPLGGCLFTGFLMICGLGLLGLLAVPTVGEAMGPLICESGEHMVSQTQSYHLPGRTGEQVFYFCRNDAGEQREVGLGELLLAGFLVYVGVFVVVVWPLVMLVMTRLRRRAAALMPEGGLQGLASRIRVETRRYPGRQPRPPAPEGAVDRLRALDSVHADGLITDAEYAAKKAEILRDL